MTGQSSSALAFFVGMKDINKLLIDKTHVNIRGIYALEKLKPLSTP